MFRLLETIFRLCHKRLNIYNLERLQLRDLVYIILVYHVNIGRCKLF